MEGLRDWALGLVSSRLPGVGHLPLEEDWLSDRWNNDVKGQLVDGFWTSGDVDNGALASARGSQRSAHEVGHLKTWLNSAFFPLDLPCSARKQCCGSWRLQYNFG